MKTKSLRIQLLLIALGTFAATQTIAAAQTIAITGGKLLTVSHGTIENGTLLIENGKISAVGTAHSVKIPANATIIQAKGLTVYPGLFDPDTTLGLVEVESDHNTRDLNEPSDEIMPHMHVADAFHAESVLIPVARLNGITNAIVAPGDADSLSGQDALIQLTGRSNPQMILQRDIALALNYGPDQRRHDKSFPTTRMGLISQLRQSFLDAQHYELTLKAPPKPAADSDKGDDKNPDKNKDKKDSTPPPTPPRRDLKLEALLPYLHGEKPIVVQVDEAYDAESIMRVANEFHLKVILKGLTHANEILDEVASWKVPVIFGPIYELPRANERYDAVYTIPARLAKSGVKIALTSTEAGGPGGSHSVRNLPYAAGFAVAYGLPYDEALKAITLNVAEIFGVADQFGSLDTGKAANIVIANGDPLDVRTDVKQVFINGISQPMESRQTRLRDEYSK